MNTRSVVVPTLALALALGSGCSSFHGYETTLPGEARPNADVGGPYRIVEMTSEQGGSDGTELFHPFHRRSCSGASMTRYLAKRYPGTFSTDESATPLVVRHTVAHEDESPFAHFAQGLAGVLTLGTVPAKSLYRERMTTAFILPSEETTEPYSWEVVIKHIYNVNPLAAGFFTAEKGWYSGYPHDPPKAGGRGTPDPMIVADHAAAFDFHDKNRKGSATQVDREDSDERSFWSRTSSETGATRLREYAGTAIVEALNRLSPDERAALKNNLVAIEAQKRVAVEAVQAAHAARAASENPPPPSFFTDAIVRKPGESLGRDEIVGTWEGRSLMQVQLRHDPKGPVSTLGFLYHYTYEFKPNGDLRVSSSCNETGKIKTKGTWTYTDGRLVTVTPPLPGSNEKNVSTNEIAWFGPNEFHIREIAGTKDVSRETISMTSTTTLAENGCYKMVIEGPDSGLKTITYGTPIFLKRAK